MKTSKSKPVQISEAILFELVVATNRLVNTCRQQCSLEPKALLVLLYAKHFGTTHNEAIYILRQRLTRMLKAKFSYSDVEISKLMASLHGDGLVLRTSISPQERIALFGQSGGTQVVVLTPNGIKKIEEFRTAIALHAERWLNQQLRAIQMAVRPLIPTVDKIAADMMKRYDPEFIDAEEVDGPSQSE